MTANDERELLARAEKCYQGIALALEQRGLLPALAKGIVSRSPQGHAWLIAEVNTGRDEVGKYEPYLHPDTLHQISTALKGAAVFKSNSSGVRYLVLLSNRPRLPRQAPFPPELPGNEQFPFGVTTLGTVAIPARKFVNIIVSGTQGSGKSNFLTALAISAHACGYHLYLADPDGNTFNPDYWTPDSGLAQASVAQDNGEFLERLEQMEAEIARRQALFRQVAQSTGGIPPADIDQYNARAGEPLPRVLFISDETNSFFDDQEIVTRLTDLARRGRKWGVHLVMAAHNWRAEDVSRALSAMLPTRVCFRVADDTSGKVVLNSPRWGKKVMGIRLETPGRGILFYDGRFQRFQAFFVDRERQAALLQNVSAPEPLDELQKALVVYAEAHLGGAFIVGKLAAVRELHDAGATVHYVNKLARSWQARGWLTAPRHATDSRHVTGELRKIAGFDRTGE